MFNYYNVGLSAVKQFGVSLDVGAEFACIPQQAGPAAITK